MSYAELHCLTNFSFQRGASHPHELVAQAKTLGYDALTITDECSLAGAVRAWEAAKEHDLKLIYGTELHLDEGPRLVLLACDHAAYSAICQAITRGRRADRKGRYRLTRSDLENVDLSHCLALYLPAYVPDDLAREAEAANWLARQCQTWIAVELHRGHDDAGHLDRCRRLAKRTGLSLVAAGDVHMHVRNRRVLQDVMTAVRLGCSVADAGYALFPNGERHLRSLDVLQAIYPADLLAETITIANQCHFRLDKLTYHYPHELVPPEKSPLQHLRDLVEAGIEWRWPKGISDKLCDQIERELGLIAEMGYEHYFLTVHDLVCYARSQGILCQGRGSAANSAVCYCLGVTEVDPTRHQLLFERFISKERNEPPDIDIDFEHERREEVIQYIYRKYGRERAALAATVITYQPKSAIRDVGKALGLPLDQVDTIAKSVAWWDSRTELFERLRELGYDPASPTLRQLVVLVDTLVGFPRHLSQHVGGFVLSDTPLHQLVPVENAAMAERTIIQWDKDDLEALGLLKVDVLALGMLTCLRRCFDLIADYRGKRFSLATIPPKDPATYAMIQRADTVGVFQIESRAQMSMLPRLKPQCFFDLVVEVAIVRPGPIQGGMVHPYLKRKQGLEPVTYASPALERVLERTLGVPIFQEQVMQIAMVAAGFTPGEADHLRRAMAAWGRRGRLEPFRERLRLGMIARGYTHEFADRIWEQIKGFGSYGFPESHAISFALLVYVSAYLKCHDPAAFACALLNSQPMGFYAPAQIVADVRRHGVEVRPVDVTASNWDCTLESTENGEPVLRLGLRMVKGLSADVAERIVTARRQRPFLYIADLIRRAELDQRDRNALARADALRSLTAHRHQAHWTVTGIEPRSPLLASADTQEAEISLPAPAEGDDIVADYQSIGLTLRRHPMDLLRAQLTEKGILTAENYAKQPNGARIDVAGIVTIRQRPSTANGVVFVTLEDETGSLNVIVWPSLVVRYRQAVLGARLMRVKGVMQRQGEVRHCVARYIEGWDELLGTLPRVSRDFH